jgi:DUF2971 family protein
MSNIPPQTTSNSAPNTLYHYTTLAGVIGIASSKTLWATSIRHLNDATEFTYAHGVLRQALEGATRGAPPGMSAAVEFMVSYLDVSRMSVASTFIGKFGATYVTSLSSEPDKLSQWRAYSAGGGYALGFRVEALKAIEKHHGFRLVKCSYDPSQHVAEAQAIADRVISRIQELPENILASIEPGGSHSPRATQSWLFPIRQAMTEEILQHASVWKHPSFVEESEWRLVSEQRLDREVKFRAGQTAIIPYVEIKLDEMPETQISNKTAVLNHTYIGPCPEPEIAIGSVQHLLETHGMSCPQYTFSPTPYRHW